MRNFKAIEVFKRVLVAVLAVVAIVGGGFLGYELNSDLVGAWNFEDEKKKLKFAGEAGLLASVLSLALMATEEGLSSLIRLLRYIFGKSRTFRPKEGIVLFIGIAALSALPVFSALAYLGRIPPSPTPHQQCETKFEVCSRLHAGTECDTCEALQTINQQLERLRLDSIGAFPLWFSNAHTDHGELNSESEGVALADDQFESWRPSLFEGAAWHPGIAYCVVGHSSVARFKGWPQGRSDELNCQAANLRADNVAAALRKEARGSRVASCHWESYDAMVRPKVQSGEHLSDADRQLFSRSVFVHAVSSQAARSTEELGPLCDQLVSKRFKMQALDLKCVEDREEGEGECA